MLRWYTTHVQQAIYDHTFWLVCGTPEKLRRLLDQVLDIIDLPERGQESHVKVSAFKRWLQENDRWLLMFDNVGSDHYDIANMLVNTLDGDVIFTSQQVGAVQKLVGSIDLCLGLTSLPVDAASELLLQGIQESSAIKHVNANEARDYAMEIGQTLGYLPLAVDAAAAYIKATDCDLPTFLLRFKDENFQQKVCQSEVSLCVDN